MPILVSLPGSAYATDTLSIDHDNGAGLRTTFQVENATSPEAVDAIASTCEPTFESYDAMVRWAVQSCRHLAIVPKDMLEQLGSTFVHAIGTTGRKLFTILDDISSAHSEVDSGRFSGLCTKWLKSELFSDASNTEKTDKVFKVRMRFSHPCTGALLDCFWHGKIRPRVYRMHFEWPPPLESNRLFVAYFGPKLTKK